MKKIKCQNCDRDVMPMPYCVYCGKPTGATEEQLESMAEMIRDGEKMKKEHGVHEVLMDNEWMPCEPVDPLDEEAGFFRTLTDNIDGTAPKGTIVRGEPYVDDNNDRIERHWILMRVLDME